VSITGGSHWAIRPCEGGLICVKSIGYILLKPNDSVRLVVCRSSRLRFRQQPHNPFSSSGRSRLWFQQLQQDGVHEAHPKRPSNELPLGRSEDRQSFYSLLESQPHPDAGCRVCGHSHPLRQPEVAAHHHSMKLRPTLCVQPSLTQQGILTPQLASEAMRSRFGGEKYPRELSLGQLHHFHESSLQGLRCARH